MLKSIKSLFHPEAEKHQEVVFISNSFVAGIAYEAGEVAIIPHGIARDLCNRGICSNREQDALDIARQKRLEALLPEPGQARPLPDGWEKLPQCFGDWWQLNERGLLVIRRARAIEERTLEKIMRFTHEPDLSSLRNVPSDAHRSALISSIAAGLHIGDLPAEYQSECRYLKDANVRAQQAVSDWKEANHSNLIRLNIECSDAVFSAHGELNRTCRDLSDTALAIFRARLAPLGLSEMKTCELFSGSADAQKYHSVAPGLQNVKMLWFHDSGRDQKSYIDFPVSALAQFFEQWTERNRQLSALLKTAKGELARALKVAA